MKHGKMARSAAGNGGTVTLEDAILRMAKSGELKKPARLAIRRLRQKGIPITFRRGNTVITQHADGREEVVAKLEEAAYQLPPGVKIIEGP